ncbi:MAG: hypothetical protein ABI981_06840 [Betaproteobacteria bacterium]
MNIHMLAWPLGACMLLFGLVGLRLCWKAFKHPDWVIGADLVPFAFVFALFLIFVGALMLVLPAHTALFAQGLGG